MSLLWYYRPEHTQGGRNPSMHQVSHPSAELGYPAVSGFLREEGICPSISPRSQVASIAGG